MNKLYILKLFVHGYHYCTMSTFHEWEIEQDLMDYPEAYLIENNDIHEVWRADID